MQIFPRFWLPPIAWLKPLTWFAWLKKWFWSNVEVPYIRTIIPSATTLHGATAFITGSSSGIGKEIARQLHELGANVIISGRDKSRCDKALEDITSTSTGSGSLEIIVMDLSDFQSVRSAAKFLENKPINYMFLNAGIVYHAGNSTWLTHSGVDYLMASNFFGHFLLSQLLMPPLMKHKSLRRVIITSSIAHWFGVPDQMFRLNHSLQAAGSDAWQEIYGSSKLANLLHAYELQHRLRTDSAAAGVAVVPVTPGLVVTDILNAGREPGAPATHYWCSAANPLAVPVARGAQTSFLAALAPEPPQLRLCAPYRFPGRLAWLRPRVTLLLEGLQRLTWRPHFALSSPKSCDPELARRLWEHAERVVGLV